MDEHDGHFCVDLTVGDLPREDQIRLKGHRAAGLRKALWDPGARIRIRFLDGDPGLRERVRMAARAWVAPGMANVRFEFAETAPSDIRIAFAQGKGSWSYIGKLCRSIPEPKPTMNFGWLTPQSSDDAIQRVVLHEFGHALGLIHEHQNPNRPIAWNRAAVIHDLSGPPNLWNPETIAENMFKKYEPDELAATKVDPTSIMMYPIPRGWTLDGTTAGLNSALSPDDKALIRQLYPSGQP